MELPPIHIETLLPLIDAGTTEDDFHEMVMFCYMMNHDHSKERIEKVRCEIELSFKEIRKENNILYNPHRNISLDQCIGNSKTPVSEWMNFEKDNE